MGTEALTALGARGMEALKAPARGELEGLRQRIRGAAEEAEEFRTVARQAREVALQRRRQRALEEAESRADEASDEDSMLLKQKIQAPWALGEAKSMLGRRSRASWMGSWRPSTGNRLGLWLAAATYRWKMARIRSRSCRTRSAARRTSGRGR